MLLAPVALPARARGARDGVDPQRRVRVEPDSAGHHSRPGGPTPRFYGMTHIAMFDAINAIEREFEPYRVRLRHAGGGSPNAAAAQAAHDVLVALNPAAAATYDARARAAARRHPSGFVRRGAAVGARVARGDSRVAPERWLGGLAVPAVFRAAPSGTLAADAAEQPRRRHSPIFRTPRRWRC